MSEQYYQSSTSHEGSGSGESGPSSSGPEDVSPIPDPQRLEAKASSNFYFRSVPDVIPEDTKTGEMTFNAFFGFSTHNSNVSISIVFF